MQKVEILKFWNFKIPEIHKYFFHLAAIFVLSHIHALVHIYILQTYI